MNVKTRSSWRSGRAALLLFAVFGSLCSSIWAQPANDNFADAQVLAGPSGSVTGSNDSATGEAGEPNHVGLSGPASAWYSWSAPADGLVIFDTFGCDYDSLIAVYTGSNLATLQGVIGNDDADPNVYGPSAVKFYAHAGTNYMIAVDGFAGFTGNFFLNWGYRSAGKFQFTSATTLVSEEESSGIFNTSVSPSPRAALLTVTRLFGSSGRVKVDYETQDGIAVAGTDYSTRKSTLVFNDNQMSATISVPIFSDGGQEGVARDFSVVLSNPRFDDAETATNDIAPPLLNPGLSTNTVTIGDLDVDQDDASIGFVFNFVQAVYRCNEWIGTARIYVTRSGTNTGACSVSYRINHGSAPDNYNSYTLQAGSDYVMPNYDYTPQTGTISWGDKDFVPKAIDIPIIDDGIVEFNEDMLVQLYSPSGGNDGAIGQIGESTLTILFDDQPAGALDRNHNKDNSNDTYPQTFNPAPGTDGTVYGMAIQPDNKAIIVGDFTQYDIETRMGIARVLPNGLLDYSFAPISGADGFVSSVALDVAGRVIIGGGFTTYDGVDRNGVARLNPNGTLDTTFNPGVGANGIVWAVLAQGNYIYVAGDFTTIRGVPCNHVARFNDDGSLDTSFNTTNGPTGSVHAMALQSDGKLIIGGEFLTVNGISRKRLARLNVDGSIDVNYDIGVGFDSKVYSIALQSDEKAVVGGAFKNFNLIKSSGLVRLNQNGSIDTSFDIGIGANDAVYAVTIQPDQKILVGGIFNSFNGTRRVGLTRLFSEGYVDTTFLDTAYNQFAGLVSLTADEPRSFVFTIGVQADNKVLIGGGFDRVGGGNSRVDNRVRKNFARLIGGETTGPGNIGFVSSTYNANESARVFITITRFNGFLGPSAADFTATPLPTGAGAATYGSDFTFDASRYGNPTYTTSWSASQMRGDGYSGPNYNLTSVVTNYNGNTITWFGGSQLASIYVDMIDDSAIEGNESSDIALSIPNGTDVFFLGGENIPLGTALGKSKASLTILDNDGSPGVLNFSSTNYVINEAGSSLGVDVVRTEGSRGLVQVSYSVLNGTNANSQYNATLDSDYGQPDGTGTLSFFSSVTSQSFNIPILEDTAVEKDEQIVLRLTAPTRGATLGVSNAVVTILDNDTVGGKLSFSSPVYDVNENAGSVIITVNRSGGTAEALTVPFIASNLIASATNALVGVDYIATNGVLSWAKDDYSPKTFTVRLVDDQTFENTEKIDVRLGIPSTGTNSFGTYTNAIINIVDDERYGSFAFNAANYFASDVAGTLTLIVQRNGGIGGTATVDYLISNGTATNGVHFSASSGTLTFPPGVSSTNIQIYILPDDSGDSANRSFTVTLSGAAPSGANGASVGTPGATTVNIINHNLFNEPAGSVDPTFAPSPGANSNIYAVALQADGKVVVGGDFNQLNGIDRLRIGRFETNGLLDTKFSSASLGVNGPVRAIVPQKDGRVLIGGTFSQVNSMPRNNISRLTSDGQLDTSFNPGSGTDGSVFAIAEAAMAGNPKIYVAGAFSLYAGNTCNGIVRLNTNGVIDATFMPNGAANGAIYAVLPYPTNSVNTGKILVAGDFTTFNGVARVRITRINADGSLDESFDPVSGANGSIRALALQPDGNIVVGGTFTSFNGASHNHVVRLNPNGAVDSSFNEVPGANGSVYALALQVDGKILVAGDFTTANGVTRNRLTRLNADGTVDPSINFGTGANAVISAIAVQQDGRIVIGGGFTTVDDLPRAYIARLHGGALSGSGTLEFEAGSYQVVESTNAVISIRRRGGTGQAFVAVTVDFDTVGIGQAAAGQDFVNVHTNIVFPIGETFRTVTVPIINDTAIETDEQLLLTLTNPTGEAVVTNQPTATLTIQSDDSAIGFASATYRPPENSINGNTFVTLVRTGSLVGSSSVTVVTGGAGTGTATAGTDFGTIQTTVTFNAGESNKTVSIPIYDDSAIEGDETIQVNLTGFLGSYPGAITTTVLTIVDDDFGPGQISFASNSFSVNEADGTTSVTVSRSSGNTGLVSVQYTTTAGSATPGSDYTQTTDVLSFENGETSKTISIPIVNDSLREPNETFTITLVNATGGATIISPNTTTVTIVDDDAVIAPAGTILTSESAVPTNSVIDPGETVKVMFALRNVGKVNVANLVATLLSTNGVTTTNAAVTYGFMATNGASVAREFKFTAVGTNGSRISPTLDLKNGTNSLGTVSFDFTLGDTSTVFSNTAAITIRDNNTANPYPSVITVSGVKGVITKVKVTLNNVTHHYPDDIEVLLVSPSGQSTILMADAGGNGALDNTTITFDDAASTAIPDGALITSTSYRPAKYAFVNFPADAPSAPYSAALSTFTNSTANGDWKLYVQDDLDQDAGSIASGWSLAISSLDVIAPSVDLTLAGTSTPATVNLGGQVNYTLSLTNLGPATATNVNVAGNFSADVVLKSSSGNVTATQLNARSIRCNLNTSIVSGGTATISFAVRTAQQGSLSDVLTISSSGAEVSPANNSVTLINTVTSLPQVGAARAGTSLTLSWPVSSAGYVLEGSTNLVNWAAVGSSGTVSNNTYILTIPFSGAPNVYYRLKSP